MREGGERGEDGGSNRGMGKSDSDTEGGESEAGREGGRAEEVAVMWI